MEPRGCRLHAEYIRTCMTGTDAAAVKRLTNQLVVASSQATVVEVQHMIDISMASSGEEAKHATMSSDIAMQVVVFMSAIHHSFGSREKWAYEEWSHLKQRVNAQNGPGMGDAEREETRKVRTCGQGLRPPIRLVYRPRLSCRPLHRER